MTIDIKACKLPTVVYSVAMTMIATTPAWPGSLMVVLIFFFSFNDHDELIKSYNENCRFCYGEYFRNVCLTVENGPKWKWDFRYPVSQFSSDFYEIL